MKFLCAHHRQMYQQNAHHAFNFWVKALGMARIRVGEKNWPAASVMYGHAYEVAQIMLSSEANTEKSLGRFLSTAIEFGYSLRKNNCADELANLIACVEEELRCYASAGELKLLLRPLNELTDKSETELDEWIDWTLCIDMGANRIIH